VAYEVSFGQFAALLASMDETLREAIIKGLQSSALRLEGMAVAEVKNASPYPAVDRGELMGSADTTNVDDGAIVGFSAPHAPMMEYGTRPFMPPFDPIYRWVIRKGLATDPDEAEEIAEAVRWSISRYGIEPRQYLGKAFKKLTPIMLREVERALDGHGKPGK
jgi:phage gpG-like protein